MRGDTVSEDYTPRVGDEVRAELVVVGRVDVVHTIIGQVRVECRTSDGDTVYRVLPLAETVWTRVVPPEPEWQQGDVVLTARGRVAVRLDGGDWMLLSSDGDQVGVVADVVLTRPLTLLARDGQPWTSGDAEPAAAEGPQWRPGHVVDAACDCRFVRGHDMWRCHISWPHCDLDHSVGDVYHTEDLPAPLTVVSTPVDRNGGAV